MELCRKDDRLGSGKLDDDVASLEQKIYRHLSSIDMSCYVTEKALENLALEKESIHLDLAYFIEHSARCASACVSTILAKRTTYEC